MKRIVFFLGLIIACGCSQAQNNTEVKSSEPNIGVLPKYKILTKDSVYLTNANLKKGQPVMIIYFSPDCSHCQHLMYEMKPKMSNFKHIQIVMVTFTPTNLLKMLQEFYRNFGLAAYPNISMGTEYPDYMVQRYYQVQTTPFIAVYDHKGKLVQAFRKAPKMNELIAAVKKT